MKYVACNPNRELLNANLLDQFFSPEVFGKPIFENENWAPKADTAESENSYLVTLELPGLKKEDVKVTFENKILTISGTREKETEEKDYKYHRVERNFGSFKRSFRLPKNVKVDEIDAKFQNGLLFVNIPKAEEVKPKSIEVKIG